GDGPGLLDTRVLDPAAGAGRDSGAGRPGGWWSRLLGAHRRVRGRASVDPLFRQTGEPQPAADATTAVPLLGLIAHAFSLWKRRPGNSTASAPNPSSDRAPPERRRAAARRGPAWPGRSAASADA